MKIKNEYSYSNNRQIWRLLPTDTEKLVIEDRNISTREVFYNCLDINTGEKIFENYQLDEKYWTGIEAIHNDIIYFHKYLKPDMPGHLGIIAFDIISGEILWTDENHIFLFVLEDKLYCYNETFEGRTFFTLDLYTGELIEELGEDSSAVNLLRAKSFDSADSENYIFPSPFYPDKITNSSVIKIIEDIKKDYTIAGSIDYAEFGDVLLLNFHEVIRNGSLSNRFMAIDIFNEKVIFKDILNKSSKTLIPDSFFVKDKLIFLLKEKNELSVCSLIY